MSYQRLYCLDVGQGMCSYFEEYDEDNDIVANALFDLGSTKARRRAGRPTVAFLKQQIIARSDDGNGYVDAIFLSHKDADHINLLRLLLAELPDMGIGYVFHSGRYDWYGTKSTPNILTALGRRTEDAASCILNFRVGTSSFPTGNQKDWHAIWSSDNAAAYVIAVNTPLAATHQGKTVEEAYKTDDPDGDLANSTSLGIYLGMYKVGAVIFGDATFSTFQFVNKHFLERSVWLSNTFMLQAPHHGSRSTTFGLKVSDAIVSEEANEVVKTFASLTYGATIIVSADTSHDHPSLNTIDAFEAFADKAMPWWVDENVAPNHLVSVYFDIPPATGESPYNKAYTYQTNQNFYTTLYYGKTTTKGNFSFPPQKALTAPTAAFAEGMNWGYEINADSSVDGRNIPMAGFSSNRLPTSRVQLDAAFLAVQRPLVEAASTAPPAAPPKPSGAARPAAHAQRILRRLVPRR